VASFIRLSKDDVLNERVLRVHFLSIILRVHILQHECAKTIVGYPLPSAKKPNSFFENPLLASVGRR